MTSHVNCVTGTMQVESRELDTKNLFLQKSVDLLLITNTVSCDLRQARNS